MKSAKYFFFSGVLAVLITASVLKFFDAVPMMPEAAALEAEMVDHAFQSMLRLTIPIFGLVLGFLITALLFFRSRSRHDEGVRFDSTHGRLLETSWILTSLVLTLGLAAYGSVEVRRLRGSDQADLDIQVTGSQWSWEFFYPAYDQYGSKLTLPRGKRVRLILTSKDVVHSFWVPQFRVKQDALPGKIVKLYLTPSKSGSYELLCAELCGTDHTGMTASVEVVEPEEFESRMQSEGW